MAKKYLRVNLRVPGWAQGGQMIEASAAGKKFAVQIPAGLQPGQYFTVRVPTGGGAEMKHSIAPPEIQFNLEPNIVIGNDKYYKEVKSCGEWCDVSQICCPYVRFAGKNDELVYHHQCCCLPCCCNFSVKKKSESKEHDLGTIALAGCCDQPLMAVLCPCCYVGPLMQAKFQAPDGNTKYLLKSEVKCCQYCCIFLALCSPCYRTFRFCCTDHQYTTYEQNLYGPNLSDNDPVAKVIYTERMICPCIPDERVQMRIEPNADKGEIPIDDLVLLSIFPTLISGYVTMEFLCPIIPMLGSLPQPSGISVVDDANNIQFAHMNVKDALATRQENDMA
ncbi:hypothetical protein AAMO2058_000012900 [Amorphochlora amoebiformis]